MADKTFCVYGECPLKDCERHLDKLPKKRRDVSFADFAPTCKKYLRSMVKEVQGEIELRNK